ncbi:protein AMN1 homolog [Chrysoperla carnea]|uniref:protein AMN1 homolog n=1 Tax=Chrysoperla carnea TaxID=189513 RepID=UPI001D08FD13|nr:protein AMN1 homolog [Chrysoperla carnea]
MENLNKSIVPRLVTRCIDVLVFNIELHKDQLKYLPVYIKNNILKRIDHYSNLKSFFQNGYLRSIIHGQTKFIDLRSIAVCNDILEIISTCKELNTLFLSQINSDKQNLENCFKKLSYLKNLEIRNCDLVTDDLIQVIAKDCPNLVQLNIGGCKNVSDLGLLELCESCKYLRALDISYSKVTTKGIKIFVYKLGFQLTDLRLNNCDGVTDEAIVAIFDLCPNLEMLLYNNCGNVKDDMISIDKNNSNLKQISWTIAW